MFLNNKIDLNLYQIIVVCTSIIFADDRLFTLPYLRPSFPWQTPDQLSLVFWSSDPDVLWSESLTATNIPLYWVRAWWHDSWLIWFRNTNTMSRHNFTQEAKCVKSDADYGTPQVCRDVQMITTSSWWWWHLLQDGTMTAVRGRKAHQSISREVVELCEVNE